jgi:hypothetical protein
MDDGAGKGRERLLDPIQRISEILFGLIMAVTIVGSLSIATTDRGEVRTVLVAALGCNLAWGLVDAVMYLLNTLTQRSRNRALAARVRGMDAAEGRRVFAESLPEHVGAIAGPEVLEGMRRGLLALPVSNDAVLRGADFLAAVGIFLLVVVSTFPVVVPFMLTDDAAVAMRHSRIVTLGMLFFAGFALGRYASHPHPALTGLATMLLGAVLIVTVMALGG